MNGRAAVRVVHPKKDGAASIPFSRYSVVEVCETIAVDTSIGTRAMLYRGERLLAERVGAGAGGGGTARWRVIDERFPGGGVDV